MTLAPTPVALKRFGQVPDRPVLDRLSIELTNECDKGCSFCYNTSSPAGLTVWDADDVVSLVKDCAANGVRAASLGGGEPLQYAGLFEILRSLDGVVFRSFTTNGLHLDQLLDQVVSARPDKVHVSLHFPDRDHEVVRIIRQVTELHDAGIPSGVNLLVRKSNVASAISAAERLRAAGIGNERTVLLPMRGNDTPTPEDLHRIAGTHRFQSMTCLLACAASPRFAAIGWDRRVAWCSYTNSRQLMAANNYRSLIAALHDLPLETC